MDLKLIGTGSTCRSDMLNVSFLLLSNSCLCKISIQRHQSWKSHYLAHTAMPMPMQALVVPLDPITDPNALWCLIASMPMIGQTCFAASWQAQPKAFERYKVYTQAKCMLRKHVQSDLYTCRRASATVILVYQQSFPLYLSSL
jgi:hypothetical protein